MTVKPIHGLIFVTLALFAANINAESPEDKKTIKEADINAYMKKYTGENSNDFWSKVGKNLNEDFTGSSISVVDYPEKNLSIINSQPDTDGSKQISQLLFAFDLSTQKASFENHTKELKETTDNMTTIRVIRKIRNNGSHTHYFNLRIFENSDTLKVLTVGFVIDTTYDGYLKLMQQEYAQHRKKLNELYGFSICLNFLSSKYWVRIICKR